MKSIKTQAIITGIRAKVDRSLGLTLQTPELSSNEKALFMEFQGINSEIVITPLDDKAEGMETINKEVNTKTQSQRLRAVLFLLWKQEGEQGTFEEYYRSKTEQLIEHFKAKLES
jgi:ABC-type sulfate transport system substrate-binding protein